MGIEKVTQLQKFTSSNMVVGADRTPLDTGLSVFGKITSEDTIKSLKNIHADKNITTLTDISAAGNVSAANIHAYDNLYVDDDIYSKGDIYSDGDVTIVGNVTAANLHSRSNVQALTFNGKSLEEWASGGIGFNLCYNGVGNGGVNYPLVNAKDTQPQQYLVYIGGVMQTATSDYSINAINGTINLVLSVPPPTGKKLLVLGLATGNTTTNIPTPLQGIDTTAIGAIMYFASPTAPPGWLLCNGETYLDSQFPQLSLLIKGIHGLPAETGRFRLPDLRGEFIRGWDNGRGIDNGRIFGSYQNDDLETHNHSMVFEKEDTAGGDQQNTLYNVNPTDNRGTGFLTLNTNNTGGAETRPRNIALYPCIKAFNSYSVPSQTLDVAAMVSDKLSKATYNADFLNSLGTNGWQKLPSGLILQWGVRLNTNFNQTWNITPFNIPFNNVYIVNATLSFDTAASGSVGTVIKNITKTSFEIMGDHTSDVKVGNVYWFAIGN
jgi:microcystin-dependent protein